MTKHGIFTPHATVLCLDCAKADTSRFRKGWQDWKGDIVTKCDGCGSPITVLGRDDVASLSNLRHAINANVTDACYLSQTGGMCCAITVPLANGAYLMISDDEESRDYGTFVIGLYANDEDEGTIITDFAEEATVIDHVREFTRNFPPTRGD